MKKEKGDRVIPIPSGRYNYFREELRSGHECRAELMKHLETLIHLETQRHEVAWKELSQICGFDNMGDMKAQGYDIFISWIDSTITLRKKR